MEKSIIIKKTESGIQYENRGINDGELIGICELIKYSILSKNRKITTKRNKKTK